MDDLDKLLSTLNKSRQGNKVESNRASLLIDMENFIKDNNIKVGPKYVACKYVYALYCEQGRRPMSKRTFSRYFNKFFTKKVFIQFTGYKLEYTPFNLPENYSPWKVPPKVYDLKKSKFRNILHTPHGWMVYLEVQGKGRVVLDFVKTQEQAAKLADDWAYKYFGPEYKFFNYKKRQESRKADNKDVTEEKEKSIQENPTE
jgi:hypothetical protein